MSDVGFVNCPSCNVLLFQETVQCPACKHILDEKKFEERGGASADIAGRMDTIACRSCKEANNVGLVRCWSCGSFMREDIEAAYKKMLSGKRDVIYSHNAAPSPDVSVNEDVPLADDDDLDEMDFDVSPEFEVPQSEAETYSLSETAAEESPPADEASSAEVASPPSPEEKQESPDSDESSAGDKWKDAPVADDADGEDHSVATGGDALLDIALEEEKSDQKAAIRRKKVQEKKRARRAEILKAKAAGKPIPQSKKAKKQPPRKYGLWLENIRLHSVNPKKVKAKPGALEKQFQTRDLGASAERLIVVSLAGKKGLFGKGGTSEEEKRKEIRQHLEAKSIEGLPAEEHVDIEKDKAAELKVVQPAYEHESMFAGVPVFGVGRIAVQLPAAEDQETASILSFSLTEYRKFALALQKYFAVKELGVVEGVPLVDQKFEATCQFSEEPVSGVDPETITYYESDPAFEVELVGRKCAGCSIVVSETSRRKEKIGGLNGKGIAKAKCPKCGEKFGNISIHAVKATSQANGKAEAKQPAVKKA